MPTSAQEECVPIFSKDDDVNRLWDGLLSAVLEAGRAILQMRCDGLAIDRKSDGSPVTEADRRAEAILERALHRLAPRIPVIAEESAAQARAPRAARQMFLVDPLDGTRGYAAGRDDFTINIGFISDGRPVAGLIYAPARGEVFATQGETCAIAARVDPGSTARTLRDLNPVSISARVPCPGGLVALTSRAEQTQAFRDRLSALGITESSGFSSAIKFCLLARGEADIYPRFGPTCEWDTAAGEAILTAAGGSVRDLDGAPLTYGREQSAYLNPAFVARGRVA
jgi:3'(2'),5'-bisphosphate nucleotidase